MSKVAITGNASGTGTFTLAAPNSNSDRTLTLPDNTGTIVTTGSSPSFPTTIGVGGATPAASGAGITFPATQSASSDANTLDDYEEGTFTPTLNSGFSVAPSGYTTQSGRYTKIGRVCYVEVEVDANGATANGNHLKLGGLPFTVAGSPPLSSAVIGVQSSFDANAGDNIVFTQNATTIEFFTMAGGIRAGNDANVNINNRVSVSGCYTVA
jgi:hypothetical protein